MKLLCDEGIERPIVDHLREQGHRVLYVAELAPGVADEAVLDMARELGAPLVTNDTDFGELVFRQQLTTTGIILLRLTGLSNSVKSALVGAALRDHEAEFAGSFTVITPAQIRIRRPPA